MNLSIIIPAYNEARRLPPTLQQISHYLDRTQLTAEVLVVNDGSTDETTSVVEALQLPNVTVLAQPRNAGKFAAFQAGVQAAKYDWVLLYDADGATPIAMLDIFLPMIHNRYDVLIGSRRADHSHITVQQSLIRQALGRLAYLMIRSLTGVTLKDTQCGFKLCHTKLAKQAVNKMQITRFAGDVDFIYLLQLFGGRLKEVPVEWHDVPTSSVKPRDFWISLKDLLKIRRNIKRGVYHQ